MYLPKFRAVKAKYTTGSQYALKATGENYIGYYVLSADGVPYTGRVFVQNTSQELISLIVENQEDQVKAYLPYTKYDTLRKQVSEYNLRSTLPLPVHIFIPDFAFQINKRFFAKSRVTLTIIEINRENYFELEKKTDKFHYPSFDTVIIDWYMLGAVGDFQNGPYLIEGIRTKNTREVLKAEKLLPGISQMLTNPLQGIA